MNKTSFFCLNFYLVGSVDFLFLSLGYERVEILVSDIQKSLQYQSNNYKKQSQIYKQYSTMPKTIRLKLKPVCAEFYCQSDCSNGSQFSATIQHGDTIYKSGVLKPQKQKYLQLQNLSWIQFCIDLSLKNPKVHVSLNSQISKSVRDYPSNKKQVQLQQRKSNSVFQSYLPVDQFLVVPLNKKKRFSFPILCHGEIKAQAEFKVLIKEPKEVVFRQNSGNFQLREKQNQNIKYNSQYETVKSVTIQNNKQYPSCRPLLSQTFVIITPDLFVKKPNSSASSLTEQSESSRNSIESNTSNESNKVKTWRQSGEQQRDSNTVNNFDLFSKFEKLNRKFADQEIFDQQESHESTSVWELEPQDQNQYQLPKLKNDCSTVNKPQFIRNGYLQFGTIREQIQQGSDNDVIKI